MDLQNDGGDGAVTITLLSKCCRFVCLFVCLSDYLSVRLQFSRFSVSVYVYLYVCMS